MVTPLVVEGYENFLQFIEIYKSEDPLYILYTGSKLPNGDSWCPDCVEAKPYIEKAIESAPIKFNYLIVEVGDREFWKDPKCPFRTDPNTKVKNLPTFAKWGTQQRLEGDQLKDDELWEILFTEEEES